MTNKKKFLKNAYEPWSLTSQKRRVTIGPPTEMTALAFRKLADDLRWRPLDRGLESPGG